MDVNMWMVDTKARRWVLCGMCDFEHLVSRIRKNTCEFISIVEPSEDVLLWAPADGFDGDEPEEPTPMSADHVYCFCVRNENIEGIDMPSHLYLMEIWMGNKRDDVKQYFGDIAQLGERLTGSQKGVGSIPSVSISLGGNMNIEKLTRNYFIAFSNKDIDALDAIYSDGIILNEWNENEFIGKENVLEANKKLFDSCKTISIEIVSQGFDVAEFHTVSLNEIIVWIDGKQVDVVDVIYFSSDGLIEEIRAFKGFA